ncbi:MAG: QueT transporter family protein [Candidatus Bathyarchaeota archaeon]
METRKIALGSSVAALYALGVILFAPISFLVFQVRVADALIPLSIIFGMPVVQGVTLGNIIANIYGQLGYVDIIGGSIANFLAAYIGWKIGSMKFTGSYFVASIAQNIVVSSIVGSYLAILFEVPLEVGFLGILLGSTISMNMIGFILVLTLEKSSLAKDNLART